MEQGTRAAPIRITSMDDLEHDLAGTFGAKNASARDLVDRVRLREDIATLDRTGYVVLERAIDEAATAEVKRALEGLMGPFGRNTFEGLKTQRAYSLLAKTRVLDGLIAHPHILALLETVLDPDPLLSACLAINISPGEAEQAAHYDTGFYKVPRPRPILGVSVIWAIDGFTGDNGATVGWPGSHLWAEGRVPAPGDVHGPVLAPPGSAVVFHGDMWHAGGANRSGQTRMAVTAQYCRPWLRTQENMSLAVPSSVVSGLDDALQRLLGYHIHPPFMGHVNGMHPKRLLD
ncbi:MAG: phytanoyl-CoA dioxygenase family protein [Pseudomonadota bacterium]